MGEKCRGEGGGRERKVAGVGGWEVGGGGVTIPNNRWWRERAVASSNLLSYSLAPPSHVLSISNPICMVRPCSMQQQLETQRRSNSPIGLPSRATPAKQQVTSSGSGVAEDNGCGVGGNVLPQGIGGCVCVLCANWCQQVLLN